MPARRPPPAPRVPDSVTSTAPPAVRSSATILFYGQSNAGGGGADAPLLTTADFPDRVLTFGSRRHAYGTDRLGPGDLTDLQPLHDGPKSSPRPATAMGFALATAAPPDLAHFLFTVWHGNQPLGTFGRGTPAWHNLMRAVRDSRRALAAHPGDVTALVFLQGENGPRGRETYRAAFAALLDDLLPALQREAKQPAPPLCLLLQLNRNAETTNPPTGVELAQWDVARTRPGVVLAGPSYHLPLVDRIHHRAIGRLIAGEQLALAYAIHRACAPFQPLHPLHATIDGQHVAIRFHLPPGGEALDWDTAWVPPSADYGFSYADAAGPATLRRVAITGPAEVTLTLDRPAAAHGVVRYAQGQHAVPGWASARGQLISPAGRRSFFHGRGLPVPAMLNHYCLRSEIAVG